MSASDGSRHRVVMIHRGTVGSMERVVACLLERYGALPLWLAPVQVCLLPVGADQDDAARSLADDLTAAGLRVRFVAEGSLGARIRASRQRRDALIAVLGAEEVAAGRVQLTDVAAAYRGRVGRTGSSTRCRGRTPPARCWSSGRSASRRTASEMRIMRG